jgi:hypothetical protein
VTKKIAIIQSSIDPGLEVLRPGAPFARFGQRNEEKVLGESCTYWILTTPALSEMMEYTGFVDPKPQGIFKIPGGPVSTTVVARVP